MTRNGLIMHHLRKNTADAKTLFHNLKLFDGPIHYSHAIMKVAITAGLAVIPSKMDLEK